MWKPALPFLFGCIALTAQAQEESSPGTMRIHAGAGLSTYQTIPVVFFTEDDDRYLVTDERQSPVYYLQWNTSSGYSGVEYGLDLGYQNTVADLDDGGTYADVYHVDHWSLMGTFGWKYYSIGRFSLRGGLMIGAGFDKGTFTDEVPDFDYVQWDYHYQLDPAVIRWGEKYGLEIAGGYGVRGWVRGQVFVRF